MLELKNINLAFDKPLIKDGHIIIPDERITVLSGKSGCGKSTLLYDIALMTQNAQMNYYFYDYDICSVTLEKKKEFHRSHIAFVFQNIQLIDSMSLFENIQFFAYLSHQEFDEKQAREYLTDLNLFLDDQTDIRKLSGGEKQRLAIVCALMKDTPLIILDEPTAYLDYDNKLKLIDVLILLKEKYHKTILIASHDKLIKEVSDCLYEIEQQKIINRKDTQITHNTIPNPKISSYQNSLNLFYRKILKYNRFQYLTFKILLTLLMTFYCFLSVFFQTYIERLNNTIEELQSTQIIVEANYPLSNDEVKEMKYNEYIQDVQRFIPIETDNGYLLSPYMSSDYFQHYLNQENAHNDQQYYGNYELYRQQKNENIECQLSNYHFTLPIHNYLNEKFEDYRGLSSLSRIIYIPYQEYQNLIKYTDIQLKSSKTFIIQLNDSNDYLNVLKVLMDDYPQLEVSAHSNLLKVIGVSNQLEIFNQLSIGFIIGLFIIAIIILKIFDQYQWRKQAVLLEVNGVSQKKMNNLLLKKELYLLFYPWIISIMIVSGIYWGLDLLDRDVIIHICLLITLAIFFIFIFSYFIYVLIRKAVSNINIIKKF